MSSIWPYVAGLGVLTGLGYLVLLLFLAFRRSKATERRLTLFYLGLSLLWGTAIIVADPEAIFSSTVSRSASRLVPVLATALAVLQVLLACTLLDFAVFTVAAIVGGAWTAILLLTTVYFLNAPSPPISIPQMAQGGWAVLTATLVGLLMVALVRSRLALQRNRALYQLLTAILLAAGQAFSFLPVGLAHRLGLIVHLAGTVILTRGATSYWIPNVKAVFRAILRFLLLFIATAILLLGVVVGAQRLTGRLPLSQTLLVVVLAVVAAVVYLPLYQLLQRLVNRLLQEVGFDPAQALRDYSQTTATILNLQQLSSTVIQTVAELLDVERGALLVVIETEEKGLRLQPVPGLGNISQEPLELEPSSPIWARFQEDIPLFQYEVGRNPDLQEAARWEQEWLQGLEMEVYLPIRYQGDLTGLLALGPQGTGEPYSPRAAEFLSTLAHQTGVALQNALLFEGLINLNERITQLNETLRAAYERLERLDRSKADFLTIASHELRTPLTQVRGYVDILVDLARTKTLTQDQVQSIAENISRPTRRLEEIISAMVDASEIDAEGLALHFVPTTLATTMRLAIEPCLPAIEERSITLTGRGVESISPIYADMGRLRQAFTNIISNAIKFTPDGGRISIEAYPVDEEHFKLLFCDTGIGISETDQGLIFEKFYRVESVDFHSSGQFKFKGGGPGLGLPIARGVIEGHGGCIWVESAGYDENRCPGSTFHIVLPYKAHRGPCRWKRPEKNGSRAKRTSSRN